MIWRQKIYPGVGSPSWTADYGNETLNHYDHVHIATNGGGIIVMGAAPDGFTAAGIECGSTVPVNFGGNKTDGLFYFGRAAGTPDYYEERLRVYDRAGRPCPKCGGSIKRIKQAARSTFYCPRCQRV